MEMLRILCQLIVGFGLLNVWLLRLDKQTAFRGGSSRNMREEFSAYGLPGWFMWLVGFLKVVAALSLLAGIFLPDLVLPASVGLVVLMLGAVAMHLKAGDPPLKSLPAAGVLALSLFLALS